MEGDVVVNVRTFQKSPSNALFPNRSVKSRCKSSICACIAPQSTRMQNRYKCCSCRNFWIEFGFSRLPFAKITVQIDLAFAVCLPDPHFSSAFPSEVYKKRWEFVPLLMLDQTCSTATSWKNRYHFQRHGQDEIGWEHKRKPPDLTNNPSHARSVPCLSSAFWILFSSSKYQSHVKCKPDLVLKTLNNSTFLSQEYHFCQGFEISVEGEEASSNVCSMVERAGTGSRLIHQRGCKLWTAMMFKICPESVP